MCWAFTSNTTARALTYVLYDTVGQLPPDALEGDYEIMPNGSAESWNKPQQLQKAMGRLQMFRGSPYWRQDELEKSVMELDDPRMIKRAFTDPGQTQKGADGRSGTGNFDHAARVPGSGGTERRR